MENIISPEALCSFSWEVSGKSAVDLYRMAIFMIWLKNWEHIFSTPNIDTMVKAVQLREPNQKLFNGDLRNLNLISLYAGVLGLTC